MTSNSQSAPAPKVPAALLNERRDGWHAFTRFLAINIVALVVFLLLMLLVFKG